MAHSKNYDDLIHSKALEAGAPTVFHNDIDLTRTVTSKSQRMPEFLRNMTDEERNHLEAKLRRKIDIRLLPMLVVMYIMNYLDRNNIASARVQGLQKGLHLTDTEYQTCVSILFAGYLLMQVPSNLFLNKIGKPSLYLPTAMVIWGIISACKYLITVP